MHTDVCAVRLGDRRSTEIAVDYQRDIIFLANRFKHFGFSDKLTLGKLLVTQLYHCRSALYCFLDSFAKVSPAETASVSDSVKGQHILVEFQILSPLGLFKHADKAVHYTAALRTASSSYLKIYGSMQNTIRRYTLPL